MSDFDVIVLGGGAPASIEPGRSRRVGFGSPC